jgi:DMSO/TMAO reductase YedYZ molybdopterin-dependent catalytic subunit
MTDDAIPEPPTDTKLVKAKQRWAQDGRLLTGTQGDPERDRLPPGQRLVRDWPVLDLGQQPEITAETYYLDINGDVEHRQHLKLADLLALPQTESVSDMHCVTQWSRYDNHWKGISTRTLVDLVKPRAEVRHVLLHARDGYTTNVRFEQFVADDVVLVHQWEGQPIDRPHGGPVRLIIPHLYLWKSPKWLSRIEFSKTDRPGFWERNGYHNNADPWLEERYG